VRDKIKKNKIKLNIFCIDYSQKLIHDIDKNGSGELKLGLKHCLIKLLVETEKITPLASTGGRTMSTLLSPH